MNDDPNVHPKAEVDHPPEEDPQDSHDLHLVGIGASAGGVGALKKFFEALPADTKSTFVVIMHLSPEHESHLAEILEHATEIPVTQVLERTKMQPGEVFVIPPKKTLEIADGHLIVTDFTEPRGQRAPIDIFFRTLSQAHPDGIGIVMSGSGTDGTVGMKAIKQQGGVLMVQLPDEADYDSMPSSAISTDLVDFVLPAKELAQKVEELAQNRYRQPIPFTASDLNESREATLHKILVQLQARTGHDFVGYKRSTLCRRLNRRMRVAQVETLEDYLDYLRRNQSEALALQKDFLISVTDFFRDPDAFAALAEKALPPLFDQYSEGEEMRVWAAGCATGEEVYSLAMLLVEEAERHPSPPRIQIFATDLDKKALTYARAALYPSAVATDISQTRLQRFFVPEGDHYRVKSELREMVLFAAHDLLKDPPFSNLALISCRNLLIYLQRDLQAKIYELFHHSLKPDGFLFLGNSESADRASSMFQSTDKTNRIYQRKPHTASHLVHRLPELPLRASNREWVHTPKQPDDPDEQRPHQPSDASVHQRALETHAPPSMMVDQNYDIIHLSENAGCYLQMPGGSPTANAIKLAREPLRLELRAGLQAVFNGERSTLSAPIMLDDTDDSRILRLHISSETSEDTQPVALILFMETAPPQSDAPLDEQPSADSDKRARYLAREVDRLREQLQLTAEKSETQQEELKATNEELQSINEEYKSTLEELETSKEELQSVNEELKTVNIELKDKVDELSNANNDLQNLMEATDVATLFVDRELQIKLYTPALEEIFNIRQLDAGRPMSHLTHRLDVGDIEDKTAEVLRDFIPHEETIEGQDGKCYLMRIIPYRTTEDHIEGVILTFVDITRVTEARDNLRRVQEHYALLVASVQEYAIFTMDVDGQIVTWNPGAVRLFGYTDDELLGESGAQIYTQEDREAEVFEAQLATVRDGEDASSERWHERKDGSTFWGRGAMTALYDDTDSLRGFAKVLRDDSKNAPPSRRCTRSTSRLKHRSSSAPVRYASSPTS
jgi:two-component system CheB/CheR fusion protein